ncbi:MAG TPA: hypothetical protein VM577_15080 [Anaerovoracaceae bacterium]|nr:hypothetical protein [Anaerovoracaceae bacterium]
MPDLIQCLKDAYSENPAAALNLLPELFQAADEGRIVELPCKPGTTVYVYRDTFGGLYGYGIFDKILPCRVISFSKTKQRATVKLEFWTHQKRIRKRYPISAFGFTVFTTREAAESALKEREHNG